MQRGSVALLRNDTAGSRTTVNGRAGVADGGGSKLPRTGSTGPSRTLARPRQSGSALAGKDLRKAGGKNEAASSSS